MDENEVLLTSEGYGHHMFILPVNDIVQSNTIEIKCEIFTGPISGTIRTLQQTLASIIQKNYTNIEVHPIDELHMSLSRTVILRHHWIDEFTQSLKETVIGVKRL